MDRFTFWQRFLFYTCVVFAFFGVMLALNLGHIFFKPFFMSMSDHFWHQTSLPESVRLYVRYVVGPLGGNIACCYLLTAWIVWVPFQRRETWARNAIAISFGCWFVLDSWACMVTGMYFQVYVLNLISLVVKALPLYFTWNDFPVRKGRLV